MYLTKGRLSSFKKLCQLDKLRAMNKWQAEGMRSEDLKLLRQVYEAAK